MTLDSPAPALKLQRSTVPCPLCGKILLEEDNLGYYCPTTVQLKSSGETPHYYRSRSSDEKYFECSYIFPYVIDTFHWKNESRIYEYKDFKTTFILETPAIPSLPEQQFRERIKLLITLS
jgi:hypothetical protein